MDFGKNVAETIPCKAEGCIIDGLPMQASPPEGGQYEATSKQHGILRQREHTHLPRSEMQAAPAGQPVLSRLDEPNAVPAVQFCQELAARAVSDKCPHFNRHLLVLEPNPEPERLRVDRGLARDADFVLKDDRVPTPEHQALEAEAKQALHPPGAQNFPDS